MPRLKLKICGILVILVLIVCNFVLVKNLSKENEILVIEVFKVKQELGVAQNFIYYQYIENGKLDKELEKVKKELKWRKKAI